MTDDERREAERLSQAKFPDAEGVFNLAAREIWKDGYAAACEAKREYCKTAYSIMAAAKADLELERARSAKLLYALDFYARHHHHMKTTAPNFAREAIDDYEMTKPR